MIISTRDVIFDENTRFDGKKENLADVLIKERDKLIKKIRIPEMLALNKRIVQEDDDLMELDKDNTIVVDTGDLYQTVHQALHDDSTCGVRENWPTPPQSLPDLDGLAKGNQAAF